MNKQILEMTLDVLWQKGLIGDYTNKKQDIKEAITIILEQAGEGKEKLYPCADCGRLRTKDEGGTTFTVCDACWEKYLEEGEVKVFPNPPSPEKEQIS